MRRFTRNGESRKVFAKAGRSFTRSVEVLLAAVMLVSVMAGALTARADETEGIGAVDKTVTSSNFKEGSYSAYQNEHADKPLYQGRISLSRLPTTLTRIQTSKFLTNTRASKTRCS